VARAFSWVFPYVLAAAVLYAGVFLVYRGVGEYHSITETVGDVTRSVLGLWVLFAGATAAYHIPRLTTSWRWRVAGGLLLPLCVLGFGVLVSDGFRDRLSGVTRDAALPTWFRDTVNGFFCFTPSFSAILALAAVFLLVFWVPVLRWRRLGSWPLWVATAAVVLAIVVSPPFKVGPYYDFLQIKKVVAAQTGLEGPQLDRVSSRILGKFALSGARDAGKFAGEVGPEVSECFEQEKLDPPSKDRKEWKNPDPRRTQVGPGSLWPLVLAVVAFYYLWRAAGLVFDLTVTWHHYIKYEGVKDILFAAAPRTPVPLADDPKTKQAGER
jgi:hypothetical protein